MEYRRLGPARWEQGTPWTTTSEALDSFCADPEIQGLLEEQGRGILLERELEALARQERQGPDST